MTTSTLEARTAAFNKENVTFTHNDENVTVTLQAPTATDTTDNTITGIHPVYGYRRYLIKNISNLHSN